MISRRAFGRGAIAAAIALGAGAGRLGRVAAAGRLTQEQLLAFDSVGNITLVHVTDIHAQLVPLYFREPGLNTGAGESRGRVPHLTGARFLAAFGIEPGSAEAYALTDQDFSELARAYGRMGGLDRIATIVNSIRAERGDRVLLLDGGDTWTNSWTSLRSRGQDMVDVMRRLAPDAMTGHWEFTLGAERVDAIAATLPFPFLAQNIRDREFEDHIFRPHTILERNGLRVAVIGEAFPFTPIANPRWMFPDWSFGIRVQDLRREVERVRARGADLVVLLSHCGFDLDRWLAGAVEGIDVIVGGHTHDAVPAVTRVGKTLMVSSGSHGKFVSRLDLDVAGGEVRDFRYRLIPVFADAIAPDPEMSRLIAAHRAPYEAELGRVLGTTNSLLYRRGTFGGTLDDLFCEAMMSARDAEIALSPGFRWGATLLPGQDITFEDITNACAVTYPACYRAEMSGARLKEVLEDVADNLFNPDPTYQQGGDMVRTGGLGFTIDVSAGAGRRISDLRLLRTGQPVEPGRRYVVTGWGSVSQDVEGPPIWEVVSRYILDRKIIDLRGPAPVKVVGA